ncbi:MULTISPECIES: CHASE2 domain-containing protein [Nostocales]|uniref:CHASE2 domain-containing protein n=3 Tax=Nostocales TaxID=1161 RepID=A0A0C1R520_9CYAN|nr:CHASE2 domain-containing protein [Tolypothrix bouteillei]KAF3886925.1 CHASE2 domain-containing protein [Tolypothrix bouteillei VB521301]
MCKLVVLKFADGSFEQGFSVTLQIGEEGERPSTEITGRLPAAAEMPLYYNHWQVSYRQLGSRYRLSADKVQVTNVSVTQDCQNTAHILRSRFNTWLKSEEFRPVREKWLEKLQPTDELRVILQTEDYQLKRLPWHLWDVLERYPKAELAIASPTYERVTSKKTRNDRVNILAIVGNSQGIDTEADLNVLQQLNDANVTFLVEPQRKELTDQLWGNSWDILFFAGHSSSQGKDCTGRIYLNPTDSLTIGELRYALRKAVERGLQLAIFNSCDGLGLARDLADLQIPQMIVMREPVPDLVAQEFLKYFLKGFASGEPFYLAVREARERLQGLEDKFPCATWLPAICQNLAEAPPSWEQITGNVELLPLEPLPLPPPPPSPKITVAFLSSVVVTALVCGLRFLGLLQGAELHAFDNTIALRSAIVNEKPDDRLLVVTIEDADIAEQRRNGERLDGKSLSDTSLNKLLEKLEQYQPRAIGLDLYRDFKAQDPNLITRFEQTENLVGVCKGSDGVSSVNGIEPPPEIPEERLGFSDFVHDPDGVVRRHLLYMDPEAISLCPASFAFSTQLAFRYLLAYGIQPKFTPTGDLQLGKTVFPGLRPRTGGYQSIDTNGGQILLNYRSSKNIAKQVTLTQILSSPINPSAVKDKIVLIGVAAKGDYPDYWATPYGSKLDEQMPGVFVQAHMVSQIISAVLDKRNQLQVLSPLVEVVWILGWSVLGGVFAWRVRSFPKLVLVIGVFSGSLYILCFGMLIQGYWVPFVPSALALVVTVLATSVQKSGVGVKE